MIQVQWNPRTTLTMDFKEGETVSQLIQRIKDELQIRFNGTANLQETKTGRVMDDSEVITDHRLYNLNAWPRSIG